MLSIRPHLLLGLLLSLLAVGCPADDRAHDAAATLRQDLLPYQHLRQTQTQGLLFTFFNHRAEMQTVEDPAEVPANARAAVKVTDPQHPLTQDNILVADLRDSSSPFPVQMERNGLWLDRMMPKTSMLARAPDVGSRQQPAALAAQTRASATAPAGRPAAKPRKPALPGKTKDRTGGQPERGPVQMQAPALTGLPSVAELAQAANRPQIILYSTAWCPSCRTAREYFQQRGLPFRELDVERDQAALQQYQALETAFRLRPGIVPLIVIKGQPFQGFSKGQIEAALAGS